MSIDEIIKQREEKEELSEDIKVMKEKKGEIVDQITSERRKLEDLRKNKEKFLEDREKEAEGRVKSAKEKVKKAMEEMVVLEQEAEKVVSDVTDKTKSAVDGALGLVEKAENLVTSSSMLKNQSEAVVKKLKEASDNLEKNILTNSKIGKDLKAKEKTVEAKSQEADQKLKKAKDIAYWHKSKSSTYKEE